ncbi:ABC transporter substrate-binding protein, partial [Salmonella enterica]|uniref:ABC transporter substrate-binding protein n=1 Tax=Salmonella enterica TaxID=28901 RepID=UPI003D2DCD94
ILRGNPAPSISLLFASLMTRALDEPDAMYGYIAESADVAPDHSSVTFALRPTARWHDGTQITADDVVFTLEAIRRDGHPQYRLALTDVTG